MKRCVIVAAGPLGNPEPLRMLAGPEDFVICADGGLANARALGITPALIVGDFDSIGPERPEGIPALTFPPEKDETDTMLAVMQGLSKGFRDFLILGGLKGRLDHTYANFATLLYLAGHGASGCLRDGDNEAYMLPSGEMRLKRRDGWYVSVFPFCAKAQGVTERGMKYSLDEATLASNFPLGVSNEFLEEEAVISVRRGPLLIILSKR